jgi:hypothetical protein
MAVIRPLSFGLSYSAGARTQQVPLSFLPAGQGRSPSRKIRNFFAWSRAHPVKPAPETYVLLRTVLIELPRQRFTPSVWKALAHRQCQIRGAKCRSIQRPRPYARVGVRLRTAAPPFFRGRAAHRRARPQNLPGSRASATDTHPLPLHPAGFPLSARHSRAVAGHPTHLRRWRTALPAHCGAGYGQGDAYAVAADGRSYLQARPVRMMAPDIRHRSRGQAVERWSSPARR